MDPNHTPAARELRRLLHWSMDRNGDVIRKPLVDEERRQAQRRADDVTDALMKRDLEDLRGQVDTLTERLDELMKERNKALIWGVGALGSAVLVMAGWIFHLITGKLQ
jgi:hypothetical protein